MDDAIRVPVGIIESLTTISLVFDLAPYLDVAPAAELAGILPERWWESPDLWNNPVVMKSARWLADQRVDPRLPLVFALADTIRQLGAHAVDGARYSCLETSVDPAEIEGYLAQNRPDVTFPAAPDPAELEARAAARLGRLAAALADPARDRAGCLPAAAAATILDTIKTATRRGPHHADDLIADMLSRLEATLSAARTPAEEPTRAAS
jgi:hypothetical protein